MWTTVTNPSPSRPHIIRYDIASVFLPMRLAAPGSFSPCRTCIWARVSERISLCTVWMGAQVDMRAVLVQKLDAEDGRKRHRSEGSFWSSQPKREKSSCFDNICQSACNTDSLLLDATFHVEPLGSVSVFLTPNHLIWQAQEDKLSIGIGCCWGLTDENDDGNQVALSEIYGVESSESSLERSAESHVLQSFSADLFKEVHHFAVHAYEKSSSQKGTWIPKTFLFHHTDQDVCKKWAKSIESLLEADIRRPKNLLVIINPNSGKNNASKTWEEVCPLFKRAKINTKLLVTEKSQHAFDIFNATLDEDLEKLDGIIIVGGDGLFNEVLNGLLLRRHRAKLPLRPQSHKDSDISEFILPASADLSPLLSSDMAETISAVSSDTSTETLHVEVPSSNVVPCLHGLSCQNFDSSLESLSLDYGSIFYKDGGFVIPMVAKACNQQDRKESGFLFPNPHFRIGIIPAGSTDSIAISTTGTRNAATCALHIIFGEKMPLDVVRLISWKSSRTSFDESPRVRYAASFAGYGFYGDVIKESEPHRWMGPVRYDYAGTKVFFQHKLYDAEISFIEPPKTELGMPKAGCSASPSSLLQNKSRRNRRILCRINCDVCVNGKHFAEMDETAFETSSSQNLANWKHVRGSYISVGAAVISCRNEKAPNGVAASAHLADGLLHLILVKECSRLSYLWHLIQLTREDTDPLDFAFVEEYKTSQFNFVSYGEESVWNVDGELFPAHQLSAQVFRGLVNIFASGPDI